LSEKFPGYSNYFKVKFSNNDIVIAFAFEPDIYGQLKKMSVLCFDNHPAYETDWGAGKKYKS